MVTVKNALDVIEEFAPKAIAAEYDNPGLKIGDEDSCLRGVLITVDTNEEVIAEAIKKGCNLIIEHHPSIWKPLRGLDNRVPLNRTLIAAAKNDIAIYSAHTNVDFTVGGLNDYVAERMGLIDVGTIDGLQSPRTGNVAFNKEITLREYAKYISEIFDDDNVITVGNLDKKISKVAVINGAGGNEDDTWATFNAGADVFVTSEVKYNVTRLAKDLDYAIIQVGHFESEAFFMPLIKKVLQNKLTDTPIYAAESIRSAYNRRGEIWN